MECNFELLQEALNLMTPEQKAKLLENFLQATKQEKIEQRLEELERESELQEFGLTKF